MIVIRIEETRNKNMIIKVEHIGVAKKSEVKILNEMLEKFKDLLGDDE